MTQTESRLDVIVCRLTDADCFSLREAPVGGRGVVAVM